MAAKKKAPQKKKRKTPEQLAMEAAAAAEASEREAEAAAQRLKELRAAEMVYTAKNAPRIESHWLALMRQAKTDQLQADASLLAETTSVGFKRREALVLALEEQLEDSEEQQKQLMASHASNIQSLVELQRGRLRAMDSTFLTQLQELRDGFLAEEELAAAQHMTYLQELDDVAVAMRQHQSMMLQAAVARFEEMREGSRSRAGEQYNVLNASMQARVEELEEALAACHEAHLKGISGRAEAVAGMTAEDAAAAEGIEARTDKLNSLQRAIATVRSTLSSRSRDWEARNSSLISDKARLAVMLTSLKTAAHLLQRRQQARLKQLCLTRAAEEEALVAKIQLREKVLKLAIMCKKAQAPSLVDLVSASGAAEPSFSEEPAGMQDYLRSLQQRIFKEQEAVAGLRCHKEELLPRAPPSASLNLSMVAEEQSVAKQVWGAGFVAVRA